jgi:hypothetical protein
MDNRHGQMSDVALTPAVGVTELEVGAGHAHRCVDAVPPIPTILQDHTFSAYGNHSNV